MAVTTIRALGGSFAVVVPIELMREKGLKVDEVVEIEIRKKKKDFFGAFKGIGPYNRETDRMKDREF